MGLSNPHIPSFLGQQCPWQSKAMGAKTNSAKQRAFEKQKQNPEAFGARGPLAKDAFLELYSPCLN